jgi:hypothetical protein
MVAEKISFQTFQTFVEKELKHITRVDLGKVKVSCIKTINLTENTCLLFEKLMCY